MDGTPPSNPHRVGPAYEDSPAIDDSGSDFYPQSPEQNEEENSNPQPSLPQENPAIFPNPTATQHPVPAAIAPGSTGIASPESDISSFDDVYNEASMPTNATTAAGLPQDQSPLMQTKPNSSAVSDAKGEKLDAHVPSAGKAVSVERQAIDSAGDLKPAVSAPHANSGIPGDDAVGLPLNSSSSHGSSLSTDSSDTTSSEEDEDSEDDVALLDPAEQAKLLMAEAIDQVDGEAPRTANEQIAKFTKPDVTVTPDMAIAELGTVEKVVEQQALVRAKTSGQYRVLEVGSVLCLQDRTVLGSVFDIVGRVHEPAYTVGFPSEQGLKDSGIAVGTPVFYVEAHATYVFTQPLQLARGTDASNVHDEEVQVAEVEYSDDEQEAAHKRDLKQSRHSVAQGSPVGNEGGASSPPNRPDRSRRGGGGRNKRQRLDPPRSNGPPRDSRAADAPAMSYDDHDGGDAGYAEGYQPLRRPDNLTDLMQRGPQPGMTRRQRGRRDRRDIRERRDGRDGRDGRDVNRRGSNRGGRFDREDQGPRGYGHGKSGNVEQRDNRDGRDGYRRGQQTMQDTRGGGSGYGVDSATAQTHHSIPPPSPADAPSAVQADPVPDLGRYRQGQYSSYSPSSAASQVRPYVPAGQYSQNYPLSQTPNYIQQSYHDPSRSAQGSDRQYNASTWHQNHVATATEEEYTPSFNLEPHSAPQLRQTAASNLSIAAPSIQSPQQLASALQLMSPHSVNIFGALPTGYNPLQQPQVQQPQRGGNGAANSQDISSILERFKAHGQQFRDAYR
jgi:rRNA processing protein Gar1